MKKYICIFISIFIIKLHAFSQNKTVNCLIDSSEFNILNNYLDSSSISKIDAYVLNYIFLKYSNKRDCFCNLLAYTKIFEYLLKKGLDVNYDIEKTPPIMISMAIDDEPDFRKQVDYNNGRYSMYNKYVEFLKYYERDVIKKYKNDRKRFLRDDVDNIIQYGMYSSPLVLKDILLFKFNKADDK